MASVEILQPDDSRIPGDGYVYNFEVERDHNYFAEGVLVHNCHHTPAATWLAAVERAKPGAIIWGLTATPKHEDGERNAVVETVFGERFVIDRQRVIDSGHLTEGKVYMHDLDTPGGIDLVLDPRIEEETKKRCRQFPALPGDVRYLGLTSSIRAAFRALKEHRGEAFATAASQGKINFDAEDEKTKELITAAREAAKRRDEYVWEHHERRVRWQLTQEALQENPTRNACAVALVQQEVRAGHSVIVLVYSVEHGEKLCALIGDEATLCHSKMKGRKQAIQGFRDGAYKVMVATSLADEGLDVPRASRLVLVSGGRSAGKLEQRAGRILRPFEGKEVGVVHDFMDRGAKFALAQARARVRVYDKLGYEPEVVSYNNSTEQAAA